jgi:hypothetical protein
MPRWMRDERIEREEAREEHRLGWEGCLDGLGRLTARPHLR